MTARLTSAVLVSALLRKTSAAGGFAVVLAKGDPTAGAILVVAAEKGQVSGLWERTLAGSGVYEWTQAGPQHIEIQGQFDEYIARRQSNDPDLWVIELDIPDAAQFTARFTAET